MFRTRFLGIALTLVGLGSTSALATDFYLYNTLDLSNSNYFATPLFDNASPYGTNPSAIATNGSSLWIAGFNGGTSSPPRTGIVRINDPWGTPSAVSINSIAGTPGSRGYSGLAYDASNNGIYAAYDPGAADAQGISAWNVVGNSNRWNKSARGGSGVATDPGYLGSGNGAAWTGFGSGRRALQDGVTGADLFTTSNGMLIGSGGNWRDIAFAPNGDFYGRGNNNVWRAVRNGTNSTASQTMIVDLPDASGVNGQNIAYLDGLSGGDLLIFNDRSSTAFGQLWATSVKLANPSTGAIAAVNFFDSVGGALPAGFGLGTGYFDFAWDSASQTLLGLDFGNRLVYRFGVAPIPEPTSLALVALGAAALIGRRR